ncbi:hypothetical protein DICPUDRAFT_149769 [Dictyostelium purpureum]|uniref:Conserved oligomeric Golgi complex subunit 4 n=1 Tax=Dictyostelium purpureum TaxID=5786 RepID=F0ZEM0_DICPU|nr:uncharacterized protein DICPUDRAFT_149769 [Dictyostelium purpureum]EGC37614.1 hypothetical protein DICPUDRAFT_149769 [Dictyostelium purpureum]|eukprot:XP_003285875.1 hypothetical protein DICPUDRAFT_149769 [Dictyostelium purpureum]
MVNQNNKNLHTINSKNNYEDNSNIPTTNILNNNNNINNNNDYTVDLKDLDGNLTIEDAKKHLQNLIVRDKVIEQNLKQYINFKDDLETQMESFDIEIPEYLSLSLKKSNELNQRISSTCELAENLSSKVKKLDHIRERIKDTLKKVDDIIDLKNCIEGVQKAINKEDYEGAAQFINRYLSIDKSVLEDSSIEKLAAAEKRLLEMIENNYQASLKNSDKSGVLRFCRLYVPLGRSTEAIDKYCAYFKSHTSKLDAMLTHYHSYILNPKQIKPISAVGVIMKVFEHYANIIEDELPEILKEFGVLQCSRFIMNITQQCDYYSNTVYNAFQDQFQANKNVTDVTTYKQQLDKKQDPHHHSRQGSVEKTDPRNFAQFLDETSMISKSTKFYEKFLIKKEQFIKSKIYEHYSLLEKERQDNIQNIILASPSHYSNSPNEQLLKQQQLEKEKKEREAINKLNEEKNKQMKQTLYSTVTKQKMNQLLGNYIILEEYFMVESVNKAIQMNISSETQASSTPTSSLQSSLNNSSSNTNEQDNGNSMIDFIFFVLQKSLQRSIDSHSIQTLNVISNRLVRILNQTRDNLKRIFNDHMMKSSNKSNFDYQSSLFVLNNIETSSEYIVRLKKEFDLKCQKVFPQIKQDKQSDQQQDQQSTSIPDYQNEINKIFAEELKKQQQNDRDQIAIISNEFSNCSKSYSKLLQDEIDSLFKSVQPKLKNLLFRFSQVNYEISQSEYDNNDINDPFVLEFTLECSQFLKPFQEPLSDSNYDLIVHLTIQFLLKKIEQSIQQKKFTLLGGLQFGKDLRSISTYFTKISKSTIRDKFSKLNQIASFLILESLSEAEDYWQENCNSPTFKLSSSEVQKILMTRVDFNNDQILKIKFS